MSAIVGRVSRQRSNRRGKQGSERKLAFDAEPDDPTVDLGADAVRDHILEEVDDRLDFAGLLTVDVDAVNDTG